MLSTKKELDRFCNQNSKFEIQNSSASPCLRGEQRSTIPNVTSMRRIGLARALSKLGYCSRSQAFALIRASRVRVNGAVKRDPETPVDFDRARIEVDGAPLAAAEK